MFAKTLIAASAIAATLAVAAPITQAEAKTHVNLNIGFGIGGFGPGYGYGGYDGGYYEPAYNPGISCMKGAKIVKWSGFHNVNAVDCSAPVYKYNARKNGDWYRVRVNMYGNIIGVKHL
ncbi:hypothetical protein BH10PSE7_BH10PSE7_14930 [soil metagenome]